MFIFEGAIKMNEITASIFKGGLENRYYDNSVVENIVKRLEMMLEKPESKLCTQEEKNKDINKDKMYFLSKGKCQVLIKDRFGNNRIAEKEVKTLTAGDNFGEISMLF